MSVTDIACRSLIALLRERANSHGSATLLRFLRGEDAERLSFERLYAIAAANAWMLREFIRPGDRVLIGLSSPREFVEAFFSLQFAGAIPVPIAAPRPKSPWRPIELLVEASGARMAVVDAPLAQAWQERQAGRAMSSVLAGLRILLPNDLVAPEGEEHAVERGPDDIAFLQFTSGSTNSPKGVMVTHGNLIHNQQLIQQRFGHSSSTIFAGWLPLYHDMGLIGNVLQPLYLGVPTILLSPMAFLERPVRLLQAISVHQATTCGMPNFGYAHCVDRVRDAEMHGLDLSSWQVAFNGAEPIRPRTLQAFEDKFAGCGFRPDAFYPCYGLAEATLFVTGWAPNTRWLAKDAATAASPHAHGIVCAGVLNPVQDIRIVDPDSCRPCAPGATGEIWIAGPCVARGYWGRPEETAATFGAHTVDGEGPFLRTGDLGFVEQDRLFITGRLKDLIIVRGKNHYPQDIEASVEACSPDFLPLAGASFMLDEQNDDGIVVVQEIRRSALRRADEGHWRVLVKDAVAKAHQINVADVRFVLPGAIPRTSSGKIQRRQCRVMYLNGELQAIQTDATAANLT